MALTQTLPRLRGEGLHVETAAAYFWRGLDGTPCLDSCGIFVLNRPGEYTLCWPLSAVHDRDETGLLFARKSVIGVTGYRNNSKAEAPAVAGASSSPASEPTYWHHKQTLGPGKPYACYYPKKDAREHLQDLLTLSEESERQIQAKEREKQRRAEAEARGDHRFSCTREVLLFRGMQKPLPPETVEVEGRWHGGAHYPLLFQMRMASSRSQGRKQERNKAKKERNKEKKEAALQGAAAAAPGAAAAAPEQHGPERQAPERAQQAWRPPKWADEGADGDRDWPAAGDGRSRRGGKREREREGGWSTRRARGRRGSDEYAE